MNDDDDDTQDYVRPWIDLTDEELDKLAVDAGIITWVRSWTGALARAWACNKKPARV